MNKKLADIVSVSRQFLRSINLDADLGRSDALFGYICQDSTRGVIENMAKQINQTQQRAYTWTGPYGSGKSSLALILASLVTPKLTKNAKDILQVKKGDEIDLAFPCTESGWMVVPIIGKRGNVVESISNCLDKILNETTKAPSAESVIKRLLAIASQKKDDGVLLIIDELGKFLEASAITGEDVYFYQQLGEAASKSSSKLVVIGILHQAFEQYASRLGREARDEWAKVQGRYIDIPLIVATDEVIDLVGRSLEKTITSPYSSHEEHCVDVVKDVVEERRPNTPETIKKSLLNCWPIHPITASLLGPISRKRFSQNERSVFGFLASAEPLGFSSFLKAQFINDHIMYTPARYWDYLKVNMEQAILASSDGHRWVISNDAIERTEARDGCNELHVQLAKTISLIDMFKAGSGIAATDRLLEISADTQDSELVKNAIQDLARWSIIVYRKHLGAWTIYSGSDFDIDSAVNNARSEIHHIDIKKLIELCELNPVVAKKHYHETGNLRWFNRSMLKIHEIEEHVRNLTPASGEVGEFILVSPNTEITDAANINIIKELSKIETSYPSILGLAKNSRKVFELGTELSALEHVQKNRKELEGDAVARKEVASRIAALKVDLSEDLKKSFENSDWFYRGQKINEKVNGLSSLATTLIEQTYPSTPIIHNELVNKDSPSGSAVKARRELMHQMLSGSNTYRLGYEGFSADASLFYSIVESSNLHREINNEYGFFLTKKDSDPKNLRSLWDAADGLFNGSQESVSLSRLYELWQAPPIGLKKGVMPIFALIYFLAKRHQLCLYIENTFIPELTDAFLDEWTQDPRRVAFKYIEIGKNREQFLKNLSDSLSKSLGKAVAANPLESARGLVQLVLGLPNWTKRTTHLSEEAQNFRKIILQARDPYKVLFSDLPEVLNISDDVALVDKISELAKELQMAYPKMIQDMKTIFVKAIDHTSTHNLNAIKDRARKLKGLSGDLSMDAFIGHIINLADSLENFEGLFSTTINKRPAEWVDRDQELAINSMARYCAQFRSLEALGSFRGLSNERKSFAFVYTDPEQSLVSNSFDIDLKRLPEIKSISNRILNQLTEDGLSRDEIMAIFSEACQKINRP